MRLKDYLQSLSLDEDSTKFRSLSIKLVSDETPHKDVAKRVQEKYGLSKDALELLELLNKDFKQMYQGKYKFDLCIDECEGKTLDEVNIKKKYQDRIKIKWYEFNNELTLIKKEFEQKLKNINRKD